MGHIYFAGWGEAYHISEYPRSERRGLCGYEMRWPMRLSVVYGDMEKLGLRPCKLCLRSLEGEA